jgi:TolB-like protein/Flp pilus assembly protein TadD
VTEPSHAVFLSYASQDAEAAQKICAALRAAGIEVFLDQSELRGGDVWDQKIRREIDDCALFIPIVSQHTQERLEGYFRHEWKLAIERTHHMAEQKAFLLPVVVDGTGDREAIVPDLFRAVQWTRLPAGETPPAFVERVQRLLSPEGSTAIRRPASAQSGAVGVIRAPVQASWSLQRGPLVAVAVVLAGAMAYFAIGKLWIWKPAVSSPTAAANAAPAVFSPPPHSIAVLPFVNMSGDKEQEYFSDGLTEELLNSLARINELQVAARTSAFSFKGKDTDIGMIARKLNVGAVLEGSVRRSGHTVRITAQLINAVTGFHLWSETYDRDLGDVLKLQTDIANAVAGALKVTLLGNVSAKIELGGTRNPAAFDAYLRGAKAYVSVGGEAKQAAIAAYTEAIRLDPNYALAFAGRSSAHTAYAEEYTTGAAIRENFDKAQADAREAIRLAPELAEGHVALAQYFLSAALDFTQARGAFERALALAPGNAEVLRDSSRFLAYMGQFDEGISGARRAMALDPLNRRSHNVLGYDLYYARRYAEAVAVFAGSISLDPASPSSYGTRGLAYYGLGDFQSARSSCETKPDFWVSQWCLAVVYDKLGRHPDAEAKLAKLKADKGDAAAYQYATVYAQWGNRAKALEWLDAAIRLRDPGLQALKADPLMDPLRKEPRFQAIERELKFPN